MNKNCKLIKKSEDKPATDIESEVLEEKEDWKQTKKVINIIC